MSSWHLCPGEGSRWLTGATVESWLVENESRKTRQTRSFHRYVFYLSNRKRLIQSNNYFFFFFFLFLTVHRFSNSCSSFQPRQHLDARCVFQIVTDDQTENVRKREYDTEMAETAPLSSFPQLWRRRVSLQKDNQCRVQREGFQMICKNMMRL